MKIFDMIVLSILFCCVACKQKETMGDERFQAKGKIIEIFGGCYGESIMIEIETPKNMGTFGTFTFPYGENNTLNYSNAVNVPYFSKMPTIGGEGILATKGTWLYFEYREKTEEDNPLFMTPIVCPAIYAGPPVKNYVITKIIDFKNSEQ